jgi:DNA polymerase IV
VQLGCGASTRHHDVHIASGLLAAETDGVSFTRVGVAADQLFGSRLADPPTLFDRDLAAPRRLEHAIDEIRGKLGERSVQFGRGLTDPR